MGRRERKREGNQLGMKCIQFRVESMPIWKERAPDSWGVLVPSLLLDGERSRDIDFCYLSINL